MCGWISASRRKPFVRYPGYHSDFPEPSTRRRNTRRTFPIAYRAAADLEPLGQLRLGHTYPPSGLTDTGAKIPCHGVTPPVNTGIHLPANTGICMSELTIFANVSNFD
jgi:hypothetical protein